jgi:hypothetical protein
MQDLGGLGKMIESGREHRDELKAAGAGIFCLTRAAAERR